ncbi:GPW/gp25 family protein [Pseudactinotalea terrae]|uniref:GPW/gp25 family protein n=1 Tax=Pseudactinotalea terrae TaxID=1743262 RepID=UPI0012E1046E|nr:GPW/gp25 family protein [Pseudactinotalea terrae]
MTVGWHFGLDDSEQLGLHLDRAGRAAMRQGAEVTRQAILLVLLTAPGERVMRPDYGCRLRELAFAPNDDTTAGLAMHHVRRALSRWVPEAELLSIDADADPDDAGVLVVQVVYRHRPTGQTDQVRLDVPLRGNQP